MQVTLFLALRDNIQYFYYLMNECSRRCLAFFIHQKCTMHLTICQALLWMLKIQQGTRQTKTTDLSKLTLQ